jgi:transcriptional regulator with XRE-family HTH domain
VSLPKTIGDRLRLLRRDRNMTRDELADEAGVNGDVIAKLEQGRRQTARVTSLIKIADALRADLSDLVGKPTPPEEGGEGGAPEVRAAVASPDSMPGMDADDAGEAPAPGELGAAVDAAWRDYWSGNLSHVATTLPGLIGEARLASRTLGPRVAAPLAQAHQLAARLLFHLGQDDLAALATEHAIRAAESGDDELQWAALHGAYSSALLHQGRTRTSEDHAVRIAERTEPSMGEAELDRLTVWGSLLLAAMAAATVDERTIPAGEYIGLAGSAASRFEHERLDYRVRFGPSEVAMQATHAYATLQEPGRALESAGGVHREELPLTVYGRHLIDVAQAQAELRDLREAETTLQEAESLSERSFRHRGPARTVVGELVEEMAHVSPELRRMARSVEVEG